MPVKHFVLFFCVVLFLTANTVFAQLAVIKGWEIDEKLAEKRTAVFQQAKSGSVTPDLDTFLDKYYFARWTSPENTGQVQTFVREFLTQDLAAASGNARETLLNKSFSTLGKIAADGTAPPVARYNAVLAVGQLYQREAPRGEKPVPYAQSLPYLVGLYEKKDNPEYIRLGALVGIIRHCYIGISDETLKNTALPKLFVTVIEEGKPVEEGKRSKEEQEKLNWFRLYGIEGLSALGTADVKVVETLTAVIENAQESLELRTASAKTFGDLNWKAAVDSGAKIDVPYLGTMLISLLKSASDTEIQTVTQLRDKARASQGGGLAMSNIGSSSSGSGTNDPGYSQLTVEKQLEVQGAVQEIKANIQHIIYGMNGKSSASLFAGQATAGVLPLIPADNPAAVKIKASVNAAKKLFQLLDEGLPEDATRSTMGGRSDPSMDSSERGSGGRTGTPKKDEKLLKVNLAVILKALNDFGAELDGIITGGGT